MKMFRAIWDDVKAGNIDLYLTIFAAVALSGLNLVWSGKASAYLAPLTLAVLGLLAASVLGTRHQLQKGFDALTQVVGATGAGFYKEFPAAVFSQCCLVAKREIRIMQTYIPGGKPLPDEVLAAARAGCRVRVLLLNPNSMLAAQRMKDIGYDGDIRRLLVAAETLEAIIRKRGALANGVEVRFFDSLPPFSMFAADEQIFLGLFWPGKENMGEPHVALREGASDFGTAASESFEALWSTAAPAAHYPWWTRTQSSPAADA